MSGYTAVECSQSNLCDMRSGLSTETLTGVVVSLLVIWYSSRGTLRTRRSRSTTLRRVTIAGPAALKSCSARAIGRRGYMVHGFVLGGLIKAGHGQAETLLKVAPPQFAIGDDGQAESGLFRHTGADGFVLAPRSIPDWWRRRAYSVRTPLVRAG